MNDSTRHIFLFIFLSLGLLLLLSAVPWSSLTGNTIKDFNLFEDLFPQEQAMLVLPEQTETEPADENLTEQGADGGGGVVAADSIVAESDSVMETVTVVPDKAPVADGTVLIENYSDSPSAFGRFRQALAEAGQRIVRVAFVGDSYIEGDIFSQNLRDLLQQRYGGAGVGFMAMHSDFPGFRRSVKQSGTGWTLHDIRTFGRRDTLRDISSTYAKAAGTAKAKFEGTKLFGGTGGWELSRFLFIAPDSGQISMTLSDGTSMSMDVKPSDDVQMASIAGKTGKVEITSNIPGLVGLGTYLDGSCGVQVDCMSVRGNSGRGLGNLNASLCQQMSQHVPYDLIILEFGMNAISDGQIEYEGYGRAMEKSIQHIRRCYPQADILVLGVGDRGTKQGNEVRSMPEAIAINKALRRMSKRAKVLFWDSREAMGGDGSIADWRRRRLVNADYVHINFDGGAEMAKLLDKAIQLSLDE